MSSKIAISSQNTFPSRDVSQELKTSKQTKTQARHKAASSIHMAYSLCYLQDVNSNPLSFSETKFSLNILKGTF